MTPHPAGNRRVGLTMFDPDPDLFSILER